MSSFYDVMVGSGAVWVGLGGWLIWASLQINKFNLKIEEYQVHIGQIEKAMGIMGGVLQQIPDMVPQFHLPQENPIQTLINAWLGSKAGGDFNNDPYVRDDNGRFDNGPKEISAEAETLHQ